MPSRQERRKAERDATKRAPAHAGAEGTRGAAAANDNVNPVGDWTTQLERPDVGPGGYCLAARHEWDVVHLKRRGFKVR